MSRFLQNSNIFPDSERSDGLFIFSRQIFWEYLDFEFFTSCHELPGLSENLESDPFPVCPNFVKKIWFPSRYIFLFTPDALPESLDNAFSRRIRFRLWRRSSWVLMESDFVIRRNSKKKTGIHPESYNKNQSRYYVLVLSWCYRRVPLDSLFETNQFPATKEAPKLRFDRIRFIAIRKKLWTNLKLECAQTLAKKIKIS